MNRNTILLLAGGLFSGLILWDRANSTDFVIAGTVAAIEAREDTAGPDSWYITAQTELGLVTLAPRDARPDLNIDDPLCIKVVRRMARDDTYLRAPATTTC